VERPGILGTQTGRRERRGNIEARDPGLLANWVEMVRKTVK
jgi:hypothetical protein